MIPTAHSHKRHLIVQNVCLMVRDSKRSFRSDLNYCWPVKLQTTEDANQRLKTIMAVFAGTVCATLLAIPFL
jgi:ABC-type phosphate/phosphonate transport system permease subunit